jgi:hypothetical protein
MSIPFYQQQFSICLNEVSLTPGKANNEITAQTVLDFPQTVVTPYSMIPSVRRFRKTYYLHLKDRKRKQRVPPITSVTTQNTVTFKLQPFGHPLLFAWAFDSALLRGSSYGTTEHENCTFCSSKYGSWHVRTTTATRQVLLAFFSTDGSTGVVNTQQTV